ncbi:hypothetical protein CGRA01v4_13818 [Colletotrichum graminicola]|nr:hypothetical protein CGRA01v4_13818 [Colletotrichum graminicola]
MGFRGKIKSKNQGHTHTTWNETRPRNRHRASASRRPSPPPPPPPGVARREHMVGICNCSKSDKPSTITFPGSTGSPHCKSPFQLQISSQKQGAALDRKPSSATTRQHLRQPVPETRQVTLVYGHRLADGPGHV